MAETVTLPGFVNAHSHTFQRALRGRAGGSDFWAWRELMLAEAERQTPESVRALYAETYREMREAGYTAVGEFHYLGLEEARAGRGGSSRGGDRARAPARGVCPRRSAAHAPGLGRRVPAASSRRFALRRLGRPRPPLRPRLSARVARGDRTLRGERSDCRCTSMRTSSRARSRSASPSTAAVRSSSSSAPAASGRTSPSCTRRMPTAPSSTCSRRAARRSAPARRPRADLADGFLPGGSDRASRDTRSASAPTRTCGSTRSRSCASSKGSPAARPAGVASSRRIGCCASAPTRVAARWGSSPGPTSRSTSRTRHCAASVRGDVFDALVSSCGADVVIAPNASRTRRRRARRSLSARVRWIDDPRERGSRRRPGDDRSSCASESRPGPTSTSARPGCRRGRTRRSRREAPRSSREPTPRAPRGHAAPEP